MPIADHHEGAGAWAVSAEAAEVLIARYIDVNPFGLGPEYARLRDRNISVWFMVANMDALGGDLAEIAEDFEVPVEAALAAVYYYWRHRDLIDARIAAGPTGIGL